MNAMTFDMRDGVFCARTPDGASPPIPKTQLITGTRAKVARVLEAGQLDVEHATGPDALERALPVLDLKGPVWEPACGSGALLAVFARHGIAAIGSDVACACAGEGGLDFLKAKRARARTILTNPPFDHAGGERFAAHGLSLLRRLPADPRRPRRLILLHRWRFLEMFNGRDALFEIPEFTGWVALARGRTAMMHRAGWTGKKLSKSPEVFAWFVWNLDHPRRPGEPWKGWRV